MALSLIAVLGLAMTLTLPCFCSAVDILGTNERLKSNNLVRGHELKSEDGRYNFIMQGDCNLVLYRVSDQKPLWASHTDRKSQSCYVLLQGNGNLVIFNDLNVALWDSDTIDVSDKEDEVYRLVMQGDGNAVIYTKDNKAIWATNTVQ